MAAWRSSKAFLTYTFSPPLVPQLVAGAIVAAVPRSRDVFVVAVLLMYMFALLGVQSFGGSMSTCTDPSITTAADCVGTFNVTGELCAYLPTVAAELACKNSTTGAPFDRLWLPFPSQVSSCVCAAQTSCPLSTPTRSSLVQTVYSGQNFDDAGHAMVVMFEIVTGEVSSGGSSWHCRPLS